MIKRFLLDTNILLGNPKAMIEGFEDNIVIICGTTLQELDKKKTAPGEIGYHARECCRILDDLRKKGDLIKGIRLKNKGMLMVEPDGVKQDYLPKGFDISVPDNRIISSCIHLSVIDKEKPLILVTNDISMRINATACGVKVEGYKNDHIEESGYKGYRDIYISSEAIDDIYKAKELPFKVSEKENGHSKNIELFENEFITLKDENLTNKSALTVYKNGKLRLIDKQTSFGGVNPKNALQSYALWALNAPAKDIPLVILKGCAGSAKTFLSLAAGLNNTFYSQKHTDNSYDRIIISRPSTNGFSEMGYLPGDLKHKMDPLLAPYYDNLKILLSGSGKTKEDPEQVRMHMDDMFETGVIEILALSFIRGRSLMNTYLIMDEAQNASKGLTRDVITRAGKDSKIVICGDPDQIDNPLLDKRNNGLIYAMETMKGSPLCAIITFDDEYSVRSDLAKEAVKRMK